MTKDPNGKFTWNVDDIARALKIKPNDVKEYFTDGRRVSFIIERRIAYEFFSKGNMAPTEGADYDVLDNEGGKWEVRCISEGGIYFCPSYMVGSGRSFKKKGFLAKLGEIKGYIIADICEFPNIPFWIIPSSQIADWWKSGELGTTTKVSHKKILKLISEL